MRLSIHRQFSTAYNDQSKNFKLPIFSFSYLLSRSQLLWRVCLFYCIFISLCSIFEIEDDTGEHKVLRIMDTTDQYSLEFQNIQIVEALRASTPYARHVPSTPSLLLL